MKEEKFVNLFNYGDYQFRIRTMNAFDGGNVFLFVTKKVVPMLKGININLQTVLTSDMNKALQEVGELVSPILEGIKPDELKEIMATCLAHVDILMPAGYVRLYKSGVFAVEEIEYSTKTCFLLCYQVIRPLINDFFGEKGSGLLQKIKQSMSQPNA